MTSPDKILISGRSVSKKYITAERTVPVLDKADFAFESGSITALIGRSGSGKTTLLNLCGGVDRPDSGTVVFSGQILSGMTDQQLASFRNKQVGFVFQNYFLRDRRTAIENVMMPLLLGDRSISGCRQRAAEALKEVGLDELKNSRVDQLSGGQKQRVAIARAIANHPRLILADEPTGSLDRETSREILELLLHYNATHQTTILLVTHDPLIESFNIPLVTIERGKVVPVESFSHVR